MADRLQRACAALDAANADDPFTIVVRGEVRPKELAHAEMVQAWVRRLRPDASEELIIAARGHHVRRWSIPRTDYPDGRAGYLRWRRELSQMHADVVSQAMAGAGYDEASIARTVTIVRKRDLAHDPDVQALEDALCLTFLDTQLDALADRLDDDGKVVDVIVKTLPKMSDAGRTLALELDLSPRGRDLVGAALGQWAAAPPEPAPSDAAPSDGEG